jgi:2-keto-4-pentenoate hydratase/2-oxohepta-3-ene-1,7-dioic acid hydratase in catechol pathway
MKLARFERGGREDYGIVLGERVVPVGDVLPGKAPLTLDDLISNEEALRQLRECDPREYGEGIPLKNVRLLHPIARPSKIVCLGLNYRDHAKEAGKEIPGAPIIFMKGRNALTGPYDSIVHHDVTKELDYEGELAAVIGKRGRKIAKETAEDFIVGYMVANDVSARDIQVGDGQWTRGKALDTFAPVGPWLTTSDEAGDISDLSINTYVNGERRQNGTTRDMVFSVPEILEFLSRAMTFEPGDLLLTGTPAGVGMYMKPAPRFLRPGDCVAIEISRLGRIENRVVAQPV